MKDHREKSRVQGYAKVLVEGRPGYIHDLTGEGCKVVAVTNLPVTEHESLTIIPHESSQLEPIVLSAELRWKKKDGGYFVYGFHVKFFASDEDEKKYMKLVALYHSS